MTQITNIHLFYPILFIMVGIILIVFICSTKAVLIKFKDKNSEDFRFKTHVDEHIDTTDKMAKMHDNVIKVDFTSSHEKELHKLEIMVDDLNNKFDLLLQRILKLENTK